MKYFDFAVTAVTAVTFEVTAVSGTILLKVFSGEDI
jgi:hypothetical protein